MKARVIATGEIIEVSQGIYSPYQYVDDNGTIYTEEHLEILQEVLAPTIDYWTRLEHQAAIAAMQGILANMDLLMSLAKKKACDYPAKYTVAEFAKDCAHALVEKYKKEEK